MFAQTEAARLAREGPKGRCETSAGQVPGSIETDQLSATHRVFSANYCDSAELP